MEYAQRDLMWAGRISLPSSSHWQLIHSHLMIASLIPDGYKAFREYMEYAQRNLDVGWPNFIAQQLTLEGMPQFALASLLNSPFEMHHKQLQRRFKSPKLQVRLQTNALRACVPFVAVGTRVNLDTFMDVVSAMLRLQTNAGVLLAAVRHTRQHCNRVWMVETAMLSGIAARGSGC